MFGSFPNCSSESASFSESVAAKKKEKYVNLVDLVKSFPASYSNEYLLAKVGVDTAENEPLKVWRKIQFIIHSPPYLRCPLAGM